MATAKVCEMTIVQRSWRTALDRKSGSLLKIRTSLGIRRDDKVNASVVQSESDDPTALKIRLDQGMQVLPENMRGTAKVLKPEDVL